jgi:uncharacterized RDD family membrane protein YckC
VTDAVVTTSDGVGANASRFSRLIAACLDGLLALPAFLLVLAGSMPVIGSMPVAMRGGKVAGLESIALGSGGFILVGAGLLCGLLLCFYQWYLLATTSATLGKRAVGIHVVNAATGERANPMRALVLRVFAFGAVCMIPYVGPLIGLVDLLPIVGDDRRCLHDYLAGTRVQRFRPRTSLETALAVIGIGGTLLVAATAALQGRDIFTRLAQAAVDEPATTATVPTAPTTATTAPTPPTAPPTPAPPAPDPSRPEKGYYIYTDEHGTPTIVDGLKKVPEKYRDKAELKN